MQTDYIIVGQGVCGSFLSHYLQQLGQQVIVIDDNVPTSPSRITAGIINPVTGRRLVTVWMVEQVIPFAWDAYREVGGLLDVPLISQRSVIDFFPNPFMREGFLDKIATGDQYVHAYPEQNHFNPFFNYEFGCGEIRPAYTAHLEVMLPAWRNRLSTQGALLEEHFNISQLKLTSDGVQYKDLTASRIIFCDGPSGMESPFFKPLPYAANKGEALVLEIPGLPDDHIFKKSMMLVPMVDKDLFWVGSNYLWNFDDPEPSEEFRSSTVALLDNWLRVPYKVLEHRAGLRPATLERRPFVGTHPLYPQVGILNGMGTKGCSLAPYFAQQLAQNLVNGLAVAADADVARFKKILGV